MKKSILFIFGFIIANLLAAQVGINTNNPLAVFHVDGDGKNSDTPTAAELLNDVVITEEGNVGIGTISPAFKLDINTGGTSAAPASGIRIIDGSQGAGKVLTSNSAGVGIWQSPGFSEFNNIEGASRTVNYVDGRNLRDANGNLLPNWQVIDTGWELVFPSPGTYLITIGFRIDDNQPQGNKTYAVQLMPTNNNWGGTGKNRYVGSYEAYALPMNRIYFSQALTIPAGSLTAHLMIGIGGTTSNGRLTISLGENATSCAPCTGGSYIRIN